jgi:hypothetical protein
MIEY